MCDDAHAVKILRRQIFDFEKKAQNKQTNKYKSDTDQYHDFSGWTKHAKNYIASLYVYIHLKQIWKSECKTRRRSFIHTLASQRFHFFFTFIWIKSRTKIDCHVIPYNSTREVELSAQTHTHSTPHSAHSTSFLRTRSWKSLNNNLLSIIFDLLIYYRESAS